MFGGGAFGLRGFPRQQLSPSAACVGCDSEPVGGLSLWEGGAEVRYLPYRLPFGLAFFADVGGAGEQFNPLADGLSMALGLGLRLRLWHLPVAIDLGYRLLDGGEVQPGDVLETYQLFFRLGEAF